MSANIQHPAIFSPVVHFDDDRHQKAYSLFLERCNEEQSTIDFIRNTLPDILASIGNGKTQINVIGVGSGEGRVDLEILSQLCLKHPRVLVDNEVVEPSSHMLHEYKEMVTEKPDLEHIKFTWNSMTASKFEEQWKQKNISKKVDFIHMVQMMYYVKDPEATISFFQSLLDKNGKLMIIFESDEGGWGKLTKTFHTKLGPRENTWTSTDIRRLLDARGVPYQRHELLAHLDITECFTEGDEAGELLLDFLTHRQHFSRRVSPELRRAVLRLLRDPQFSVEKGGRIFVKSHSEILITDASI